VPPLIGESMRIKILAFAAICLVAGCSSKSIPDVPDPHNIVVDGNKMTQQLFVEKYCADQTDNETCVKVRRAMVGDSTKSKSGPTRF
jgi:hypothetical protein